jgi:hypothetical protein
VKPLSLRVLRLFGEMGKDRLDLHALFEAAGNEPAEREGVLDAIDELTRTGMLDALPRHHLVQHRTERKYIATPV